MVASWRKHTCGGCCIYCGQECKSPDHLNTCTKKPPDECPDDFSDPAGGVSSSKRRVSTGGDEPAAGEEHGGTKRHCGGGDHTRTPANGVLVTPNLQSLGSQRKDLFPLSSNTQKKSNGSPLGAVLLCLACNKEECPFESGFTVMVDDSLEDPEHDPCEPSLQQGWRTNPKHFSFDGMVFPVKTVVLRIMHSNGFWSHNKYIGSKKLDHKLRCWMKTKFEPKLVEDHWLPLRCAIKEALRFKRQQSVDGIRRQCHGEFVVIALFFSFAWSTHQQPLVSLVLIRVGKAPRRDHSLPVPVAPAWAQCHRHAKQGNI